MSTSRLTPANRAPTTASNDATAVDTTAVKATEVEVDQAPPPAPAADTPLDGVAGAYAEAQTSAGPVSTLRPPGLVAHTVVGSTPLDDAIHGAIFAEAATADWSGCGIDPLRYVDDRLDRDRFLTPLLTDPEAQVVVHRRALSISKVPGVDPRKVDNVCRQPARDWPGRVYKVNDKNSFHIVAIPGEDWTLQTLHMLASAGVPPDRIRIEGSPDLKSLAANDLDKTLAEHQFDSVVIGTIGAITQAVERCLREREQPAHLARCLAKMSAFLEDRAVNARPDRRARWQDRLTRLNAALEAGANNDDRAAGIQADPDLTSALSEHLRELRDGAQVSDLPLSWKNCKAKVFSHRVLEVDGHKHLIIRIAGAHGDLAHAAISRALERQPGLGRVAMYGSCGSLDSQRLPPDTFVRPRGNFASIEKGRAPLVVENAAHMNGAVDVNHTNVSTLLREHRAGLAALEASGDTVDIEAYQVARAVAEAQADGREVELRSILRVSDVADDPDLGAHREDRDGTSDYSGRRDGEEDVAIALGLVAATAATIPGEEI